MEFLSLFKVKEEAPSTSTGLLYKDEMRETEKNLHADTTPVNKDGHDSNLTDSRIKKVVEDIKVLKERTKYGILRCDYEYIPTRGKVEKKKAAEGNMFHCK